jgi:molybdate transport system substrate-binding protein
MKSCDCVNANCRWRTWTLFKVLLVVLALAGAPDLGGAEIMVFAAASLSDALKEIASNYQRETGNSMVVNLGASSTLARQIDAGATADVFFSADEAKMDTLEKNGLIVKDTRKNLLSNSLVIVVAADRLTPIKAPQDLATDEVKRIALAEPNSVPAGVYAKAYLRKLNLWSSIENKVIPTENVRAALAAVESGNVEAGIVYKTDAAISKRVQIAYEVSPQDGPEIRYPVAVVKSSQNIELARQLIEYLGSNKASRVFQRYGFIALR